MPLRDRLAITIGRELLGPRDGLRERLKAVPGSSPPGKQRPPDPSYEYVVGVLEPRSFKRGILAHFGKPSVSGSQDVEMEEKEDSLDDEEDTVVGSNAEISPELDPRALPKSLGLSFILKSGNDPKIAFCATWARYKRDGTDWQRVPKFHVEHNVSVNNDASWRPHEDRDVTISLRRTELAGSVHVSIYLVNDTPVSDGQRKTEEEQLVFQPQLRVLCEGPSKLLPVRGEPEDAEADAEGLGLLYRDKYAMARGHLCGAVWRDVDPQRPSQIEPEISGPPFNWIDKEVLPQYEQERFGLPDIRTEYLPSFAIESASLTGPPTAKLEPISAELLSELWEPTKLERSIAPILDEYKNWIEVKAVEASNLSGELAKIGSRNIDACKTTLRRLKEGLELLKSNPDARLAFCFMNKAMHLQSLWKNPDRPSGLQWHIFQIAFILQCLPGVVDEKHADRRLCDLLWFPTGAGKTEAYLGLAAFAIALRRRLSLQSSDTSKSGGVSVISRYTLRLLTIQQFRRALSLITACEYLRTTGWQPSGRFGVKPWGSSRFSIGLWVGASVTPNHLVDWPGYDRHRKRPILYLGAVGELYGRQRWKSVGTKVEGEESEPAQVLNCPVCREILAISPTTLSPGNHVLHWFASAKKPLLPHSASEFKPYRGLTVEGLTITSLPNGNTYLVSVRFGVAKNVEVDPHVVDDWWDNVIKPVLDKDCREEFARASRPGYFLRRSGITQKPVDFEIHCPNPSCALNGVEWSEKVPGLTSDVTTPILPAFSISGKPGFGWGIPIPAYTVDDQVYGRCPSMIVGTVDKFARLAFEPRASSLFGHVTEYSMDWGFHRDAAPPETGSFKLGKIWPCAAGFAPPDLIIQDELHLIEGPLGTMVGLYETGIEILSSAMKNGYKASPKYVASTATIRQAHSQVLSLFNRDLFQFPPSGLSTDDNFFSISREPHQLEAKRPGRLYLGVSAPGRGAQTPIVRIWSAILQEMSVVRSQTGPADPESDQFWTLVGYFNAKRELGGAVGLLKADIPEQIGVIANRNHQQKRYPLQYVELSGRSASYIPGKLDRLTEFPENKVDVAFATSMFGTGVDVDRLGLMMVHGQPKTTANYIQATGRVGRQKGGLVITFLRATRPRDLDHYEFFVGYHRALHRHVEPITIYPFSPGARERALGPLGVLVLRNGRKILDVPIPPDWVPDESGSRAMASRRTSPEIDALIEAFEARARIQPAGRNPGRDVCRQEISSELDKWRAFADTRKNDLTYYEKSYSKAPRLPVVLGDPAHEGSRLPQVFKNAPQSLRDVEATITFDDE